MYYDLNIPWSPDSSDLPRIAAFLDELGYNVIALTHTISGKLPANPVNPIPSNPFPNYPQMRVLSRCLVIFDDPSQTQRLPQLTSLYDIVSLRPTSEKLLLQACSQIEHVDLISLDFNQRLPYPLKHKLVGTALARGLKFEINYAPIATGDGSTRRNIISNAIQLIRATRGGKGIMISSEAKKAVGCRAPVDVVNMATFWGLSQETGRNTVGTEARAVVVHAEMRRRSFKSVIDVIDVGQTAQPVSTKLGAFKEKLGEKGKRKAEGEAGNKGGKVARKEIPAQHSKSESVSKPQNKQQGKKDRRALNQN